MWFVVVTCLLLASKIGPLSDGALFPNLTGLIHIEAVKNNISDSGNTGKIERTKQFGLQINHRKGNPLHYTR